MIQSMVEETIDCITVCRTDRDELRVVSEMSQLFSGHHFVQSINHREDLKEKIWLGSAEVLNWL